MPRILQGLLKSEAQSIGLGEAVWVTFTIKNATSSAVTITNPAVGNPPEELNWPFSSEIYQMALLQSFQLLSITVVAQSGDALPNCGPQPWITPIRPAPLRLALGESITLRLNLADFFEFKQAGQYHVQIAYGDEHTQAKGDLRLTIVERPQSTKASS